MNEIPPVEISITVRCGVDDAFRLFTEGIGTWWPMRMHSVGEDRTVDVVIEGRNGGAVYELTSDGERHVWGTVFLWQPPNRVGFTWHPGRGAEDTTEVDLQFQTAGDLTEVSLKHRGWEKLREKAEETRAGYLTGWGDVLGRIYKEAADREPETS
ncbi:MAG: SRPBCC domain-containing protein [Betaproteobacteria bacterium]|nr:SRPBCC domain-containing protein [Betaproteobacteria bacterium]